MKNRFLILPFLIIAVMVLIINNEKNIVNREIVTSTMLINYPFFGNDLIDNYIFNYLNNNVDGYGFIDYDYYKDDYNYYITFYKYIFDENNIMSDNDFFYIDMKNNIISTIDNINYNYDYADYNLNDENKHVSILFNSSLNYNTFRVLNILKKYDVKATFLVSNTSLNDEWIIEKINDFDMNIVYDIPKYSFNSMDYFYHSSDIISNYVINNVKDSDIIYMHDGFSSSVNSLNIIIPVLYKRGYLFDY